MSTYYDDPERLSAFNEAKLNYERKLAGDKAFQAPLPTANERADDVIARHAQAQKGSEVYNTMPFDEKEETNALLGTFAAVGVELGTGIGATYALKRGQTAVKALRAVRAASIVGAAAPEPISTGLGVIGFAASEAAIWGFSNFLGQSTRVAFGIQEGISGGEMIASSIFGVGVTSNFANKIFKVDKALKEGEKLFKLGDSVGAMNAWKSMNGTINNSRTFLSGASLGLAETFVRQELEQLMNDDANRNAYEYLFAGAMGGTFNSVLTAWGNKGAWGMGQAVKLADNSIRAVDTHILDLRTKIESKGGKRTGKLNRQLNEALQSKEILEDFQRSIVGASDIDAKIKAKSEADTEPLEITPEKLTEEANTKIEEIKKEAAELEIPEIEDAPKPKVEEELPPVEDGLPPVESEKVPVTKSPLDQAREQLDAEESTLNLSIDQTAESALIKKYEDMDINKDNVSTSIPMIEKDLKPIVYRATAEVNSDIRFIADAYNNNGGLPALDIQVETLTRLKNNMFLLSRAQRLTDLAETTGGRAIQAADPNSFEGKYDEYTTKYSFRAVAQQIAYAKFSNSLDDMLDGGSGGSVVRLFDEYMAVPEQYGNSGAFKFGRDLPDEEVNDMAWQDVKELVRTYNSNLPEGGERIKLSGKGVTQATVKEQIKAGRKEVRSANELAGRLRKTVKTLETKLERIRSVVFNDGAKLYDEAGEPLVDKYGTPLPSVGVDSAVANAARKAFNEDPEIQDLNTAVKYYRDLIDETDKITAAEKELAEVARIEGGGILTEIQNKIMKANNIAVPADGRWVSDAAGGATSKESLLEELKRKIAESKKRSRDKVNDVKRAQDQIDKRDFFTNYENTLSANIDVATAGIFTKGLQTANSWRKMNLINQLPSVLAGVPTAMYAIGREGLAQPAASFIRAVTKGKDVSVATELAMDRFTGFWGAFFTNDGLMETARRSFKDGGDPTSGSASKFAEDFKGRMTLEGSIGRAKRRAVSAAESKEALDATTATAYSLGKLNQLFSIGVRGIGTLDAVTKRQLVQGTLMGKAKENARLSLRAVNPAATEDEIAAEASKIYKSLWKDDNGLAVLGELGEYDYAVDEINNSILMARQNIPDDVIHKDMGEQLIKGVRNFAGTGTGLELIVDMFMPYVAVPIRGAYKGLTITAAPLGLMKGQWHNPYDVKIKKLTEERFANERVISEYKAKTTTNPAEEAFNKNVIETNQATIDNTTRKLKALDRYSNDYAQEKLVDTLVGGGLFMAGLVGGMQGAMTGSLNWMTADQREKNKLKPFTGMGMDYRAAAPMAIPMAIGADIAHYIRLKRSGQLLENQNMFMLAASTMVQLTQEVPLFQGMKSLTTLATAGQDAKINELTKLAGSYFPIPAQIDKLIQGVAVAGGDKTIADLKGGNWSDRMLYAAIGIKPINRQTDRFGEDIEGDATFLTTTVSRQLPKFGAGELKTDFERLLATDKFNQIGDKPTTFNGAKMHSFVDEEGMTLAYAFSQELKTTRLRVDGGSNLTLKEAVAKLTNRKAWQKKYNAEFLSFTDTKQVYNEGIQEVDLLMNRYYNELKKKLAADQRFIGRFIDSSGESLTNRLSLEEAPRNILSTLR
jgi:hypothetical protein